MNTFTSGLKKTTDGIGQGVGGIASGIGKGVEGVGTAIGQGPKATPSQDSKATGNAGEATPDKTPNQNPETSKDASPPKSDEKQSGSGIFGGITGAVNSVNKGVTSGVDTFLTQTGDAAKSGAAIARDATGAGLSIGQKIASSGLDAGANVVTGTASMTGTALGGVINAAAETSGAVFEPIGSGLKTIQGLEKLGEGVEAINGLSLGAVKQVGDLTTKALNMSGKTPTFFDPDADGIVGVPDTTRGLILLGLKENTAKYAAYALHTVFSYPTSDKWIPALNSELPIHVAKMSTTRWGKNWGSFERLDWVDDMQIDDFFAPKDEKTWTDYWNQGRQGFGILLLIFEWGTTWPFFIPPVPVHEIPFADDIGKVVRKAILPTILSNLKKAREANPEMKNKSPAKVPSEKTPTDATEA